MKVAITKYANALFSPAWKHMPEAYVELFKNTDNHEGFRFPQDDNEFCFVATRHNDLTKVLGFLVAYDWRSVNTYISVAYTLPEFRKLGIHTALFNALKDDCLKRNIHTIHSSVHANNVEAVAAMEKQGRIFGSRNVRYDLLVGHEPTIVEVKDELKGYL
ncbi:GNAT family N-acetyltransferase protein [Rhizobium phage RHEph12]|nr:GNAT family N-acetyltransferase protein [Rhizobium phage RHEph12]